MKKFNSDVLHWKNYDYAVINDNLENCYNEVNNLIRSEINKKLKKTPEKAHIPGFTEKASVRQDVAEDYAQEVADIYAGKWKGKK